MGDGEELHGQKREIVVSFIPYWYFLCTFHFDLVPSPCAEGKKRGKEVEIVVSFSLIHSVVYPVAMWHFREEIAPAVLLVVDFGGWYTLDVKSSDGGLVREKLWDSLVNVPGVIMEEGFPNATGREQSIKGMRSSEFCLHPAGDTPTSCRLFDAIQSLCIPVIVSDNIELPLEGMVDYSKFSVFVAVSDELRPNWLVSHLRSIPEHTGANSVEPWLRFSLFLCMIAVIQTVSGQSLLMVP
ncbi:hypothetical protein V6N13_065427 [Hibiscus sabdariffa]|uniref:Exostosin GT47 domain-containing protein n=1 Tax=Hibiscus sabdariffa TaxID=183260 RepID=A0ABR2QQW4_9ROSI